MNTRARWPRISLWAAALLGGAGVSLSNGGACARSDSLSDIQSPDVLARARAIRAAAERADQRAVPLLVDRLQDEDRAIRFYAILALERLTGQRMGYDYSRPPASQAQAVERWREFARGCAVDLAARNGALAPAAIGPPPERIQTR